MLQIMFSNDLMDPYVIGIQSGALVGLALVMLALGIRALGAPEGYIASAIGSLLPPLLVVTVSKSKEEAVLLGLSLALSLQGLASVLAYMVAFTLGLPMLPMLLGSTSYASESALITGLIIAIILLIVSLPLFRLTFMLEQGEEISTSFGLNYLKLLKIGILISSVLASVSVSLCGILPFLGLLGANLARRLAKYGSYEQLIASVSISFIIISIADVIANTLETPFGYLPVGTLLSLIGGLALAIILARS